MNYERLFKSRYWLPKLGEITLASLVIALISGILLIPGYQSALQPFKSVSAIVNSSPFGHFLQSCHSYAGDIFLISLFLHVLEYLLKRSFNSYHWKSWLWLVVLVPISILLVFSGFLSMGSLESWDATQIFKNILNSWGALGNTLNRFLLLSSQKNSVLTILMHHASTFTVLTLILTYIHLKRLQADPFAFYYTFLLIALLAILLPVGIGTHPQSELAVVKGPWYFRGLQEMLSWMPVGLAGFVFPLSILLVFSVLPIWPRRQQLLLVILFFLFVFYLMETAVATGLRGAGWQLNL